MKTTPFYEKHQQLGAKILPFAGYMMPVEYSGINDEHNAVRTNCGVFDVSHMGTIWVKGSNALNFLQYVTTNDVSKLQPGNVQYSCFPNGKGGIVDDLLVYMYEANKYMLVVNASNIEKDWNWLNSQNTFGAELENSSERIAQLAVQGPNTVNILQSLTSCDLSSIKYFNFVTTTFAGVDNVIIAATGYTGSGGFELYFNKENAIAIWDKIFEVGSSKGLKPIGLGARDTLRLEKGYSLYGNDIDDTTSPIEAGLGWIVKFKDDKNFIDKELFLNQKLNGTKKQLVAFELIDKAIPRHGYAVVDADGTKIGEVTSGTMSPTLKKGIGMAYVDSQYLKSNNKIFISIRDKKIEAQIVALPFVK